MELFEEIRREYRFGAGTIQGVDRKLRTHRRMVRQALASAIPPERKIPARSSPKLGPVREFIDGILQGEQLRKRVKRRASVQEGLAIVITVVIGLILLRIANAKGMPQKWHAAILGTVVPFSFVVTALKVAWPRWSFWVSIAACLVTHVAAIWFVFEYVLLNVHNLGMLYWFPVAFAEAFVLLIAVKRVEEKLTGKRQYYKLS